MEPSGSGSASDGRVDGSEGEEFVDADEAREEPEEDDEDPAMLVFMPMPCFWCGDTCHEVDALKRYNATNVSQPNPFFRSAIHACHKSVFSPKYQHVSCH